MFHKFEAKNAKTRDLFLYVNGVLMLNRKSQYQYQMP